MLRSRRHQSSRQGAAIPTIGAPGFSSLPLPANSMLLDSDRIAERKSIYLIKCKCGYFYIHRSSILCAGTQRAASWWRFSRIKLPAWLLVEIGNSGSAHETEFGCWGATEQKTGLSAAKIQKSGQKHCLSYPRHQYGASDEQGGAR